jgi:hypothetical protein
MNEDLSKMLSNMLSNPDALKGMLGSDTPSQTNNSGELESSIKSMMNALNSVDDRRITLLTALRPYLSPERALGIDRAIQMLRITKLSEVFRNERK